MVTIYLSVQDVNYLIPAEVTRIFVQYYVAKIVKQYFANSVSEAVTRGNIA
ncbi:MAG: hypothetical protein V7K32_15310 [Nostoc sp.]